MEPLAEGYRAEACRSEYGDTEKRWLVVHSDGSRVGTQRYGAMLQHRRGRDEGQTFSPASQAVAAGWGATSSDGSGW